MTAEAALDLGTLEVAGTGREIGPARSGPERAPTRFGPLLGALEEFIDEEDWGRALVRWFGGRPEGDRDAVLAALDCAIAEIDALLTAQVNAVIHHPRFQKLEASWRGVRYLVAVADEVENVLVRVLHVSWNELCRDLERAIEFDQSQIFQKIYNDEFGMPGGRPYGVLVGDYEVQHRITPDHRTDDVAALKAMSTVAAAAFAPFIVSISPAMLGLDSFRDYLDQLEANDDPAEWEAFTNALTTNLTAFFREAHHFPILAEFVKKRQQPGSVWCSAASTGEEPYSIALRLLEDWSHIDDVDVEIHGADIDSDVLARAEHASYGDRSLQRVPRAWVGKYFTSVGAGRYQLDEGIRGAVTLH